MTIWPFHFPELASARCNPACRRQALEAYKFHLEQLLEEYDLAVLQLERVEQEVKDVLKQIPFAKKLLAIKGIS
ncbi:hypothetical protein [Peribacillus butanolivorans]|uniref:hypothetical protein n=1 Tax=Peribacillus butanolivorans TaxID=421767 RepID=UPI00399D53BD